MGRWIFEEEVPEGGLLKELIPQRRRPTEGGARGRGKRDLARTLSAFPDFSVCSSKELEAVAGEGRVMSLPSQWTFLHEGTPADSCYVLLSGHVQVSRRGSAVTSLGAGSVLGEMALLGRSLRRASVMTTTPVLAMRLEQEALVALMEEHQLFATRVQAVEAQRRAADALRSLAPREP